MRAIGGICFGLALMIFFPVWLHGQEGTNTAGRMMQEEDKLTLGGYGQIDYNQLLQQGTYNNGIMDVHRLVLMFGYKFSGKTQFITEIEFEHVKEAFVEQAFLQHEILPWLKLRGGLMLVPMGIINEYHEPSTFNGVERPNLDTYIVPSTWREIGAGFTGTFPSAALSYQLYLVNGFKGYDDEATLSGSNGFRKGRQKGAESIIGSPNLTFKINYFGLPGLQLGFSGYTGQTQSSLYGALDKSDNQAIASADSSVVGLSMLGLDARFRYEGLRLSAQANLGWVSNTSSYNQYTGSDLGSSLGGWYAELAYDLFHGAGNIHSELIPFIRYEQYNTQISTTASVPLNPGFSRRDLTLGLGWKLTAGAMLKADLQWFGNQGSESINRQFNAGVAVWF
ncbi:MAG: hypothetical protein P1P86_09085 [Bacteroidales bacterium]|nr:hypothetical protein [Bacteroidales bacterium]